MNPIFYVPVLLSSVIVLVGSAVASEKEKPKSIFLGIALFAFAAGAATSLLLYPGGLGDFRQASAVLIAQLVPPLLVLGIWAIANRLTTPVRIVFASVGGALSILIYPFLGIALSCAFTGDCL